MEGEHGWRGVAVARRTDGRENGECQPRRTRTADNGKESSGYDAFLLVGGGGGRGVVVPQRPHLADHLKKGLIDI